MKYFIVIIFTFLITSLAPAQKITYNGVALKPDTIHIPGMEVFHDSAKPDIKYVRIVLLPRSDGSFVSEGNVFLLPMSINVLTQARVDYLKAQIQLWTAEYILQQEKQK